MAEVEGNLQELLDLDDDYEGNRGAGRASSTGVPPVSWRVKP